MYGGSKEVYGQVRASVIEQSTYDPAVLATRYVEVPSNLQQLLDYTDRTDGQPTYMGFAERGLGISASGWLLQNFTYDASGKMTARKIAYNAWDDRAEVSYA